MRRGARGSSDSPNARATRVAAIVILVFVALSLAACKSRDAAITEVASAPVETGTVQATLPVDPTQIAVPEIPSSTPTATTLAPPAADPKTETLAQATAPDTSKPGAFWPKRVGEFSSAYKGPVWYPKYLPPGYKFESLDIVEFDPGSGLVCDMIFTKGEKVMQFTQGSPKSRDYAIVSVGKVPWGPDKADIVHQDPADNTTPIVIVHSKSGNLSELSGDAPTNELKAVAASMARVK
jgi:hypothetical protein